MGLYDSVFVRCPCGGWAEFQSKTGKCELFYYDPDTMPVEVAEGLIGARENCGRCGQVCDLHIEIVVKTNPTFYEE